ncbi:MAG: hypothetical protein NVV74_08520 [Magnetospirillum sp.]|nr:hypothetical protein [Magnetospirillum sp.]
MPVIAAAMPGPMAFQVSMKPVPGASNRMTFLALPSAAAPYGPSASMAALFVELTLIPVPP